MMEFTHWMSALYPSSSEFIRVHPSSSAVLLSLISEFTPCLSIDAGALRLFAAGAAIAGFGIEIVGPVPEEEFFFRWQERVGGPDDRAESATYLERDEQKHGAPDPQMEAVGHAESAGAFHEEVHAEEQREQPDDEEQ